MNQQVMLIGIIEENNDRQILNITKELLLQSHYKLEHKNVSNDVVCYRNDKKILIIFDLLFNEINKYNLNNFSFDILVHSYIENSEVKDINKLMQKSKVCIINTDKGDMSSLLYNLEDSIVITYGFNSKSTITISSYNMDTHIDVNLFLQRDIIPIFCEKIEPFEFNIRASSDDENLLYPILSSCTLNLLLGDGILNEKPIKNIILNV